MRRETDFVLEQAAWPAMVLEESGAIRRCNGVALQTFGPEIRSPDANMALIWAGNVPTASFLSEAQTRTSQIKLKVAGANPADFFAHVSKVTRDEHSFFLLQLFKDPGGQFPELAVQQLEVQRNDIPPIKAEPVEPINAPAPVPVAAPITPVMPIAESPPSVPLEPAFLLESSPWPALLVKQNGMVLKANRAAIQAFGSSIEKNGASFGLLWMPENKLNAHDFLHGLHEIPFPAHVRLKTGMATLFMAHTCVTSDSILLVQFFRSSSPAASITAGVSPGGASHPPAGTAQGHTDVMAHKQKLDCAMQLARSVALDFNNALTSILGHTSLLLSRAEAGHPFRESLAEIEKSASKAAEIANDLAAFTRQEKDSRVQSAGNLNTLLERAMESFKGEHAAITWSLQFERKLCTANFDEAKMQQALSKIIENSIQAMPTDGRITLQTRNLELSEPTQDLNAKLNPGNYVVVEITDTGEGIASDLLPRIFEPFFTTKGKNHRGLGLAWVYGIVTNHGGAVAVSTKVGTGTSVRVYLPANKKVVRNTNVSNDDLRGKETILFVDDEDLLLTMGQMVLSSFGYTVLTANSGHRALELLANKKTQVDVMITDLVMPGMSGNELTEKVQAISPHTRIIWASGYPRNSKDQDAEGFLQKPFTAQDLLRKVKETLTD